MWQLVKPAPTDRTKPAVAVLVKSHPVLCRRCFARVVGAPFSTMRQPSTSVIILRFDLANSVAGPFHSRRNCACWSEDADMRSSVLIGADSGLLHHDQARREMPSSSWSRVARRLRRHDFGQRPAGELAARLSVGWTCVQEIAARLTFHQKEQRGSPRLAAGHKLVERELIADR